MTSLLQRSNTDSIMKYIKYTAIGLFLIIAAVAIYLSMAVFSGQSSIKEDIILTIPTGSDIDDIFNIMEDAGFEMNESIFSFLTDRMNYTERVRAGKYKIEKNSSLIQALRQLRGGQQEPVSVTIHLESTPNYLAAKIASYLEFDSAYYAQAFANDSLLSVYGIEDKSFMTYVIPNTYFMHYNTTAERVLKRFVDEHDSFWSKDNRKEKATELGMSEEEVYTLASIVERESQYRPERPRIAGVYLNRLSKGIPLQADPTVIYALGRTDINRVLKIHLEIDSPYNTYKYAGLPPGPIGTASISSIDAVLNAEEHDYYYFCAKADNSGQHAFAKTLSMHLQNARKFQEWLNSRGIYR